MTNSDISDIMMLYLKGDDNVKAMEAIKAIMSLKGVRPSDICRELNIKSNVLSQRFQQENISVTKLDEMAKITGYKIVLVPSETELSDYEYKYC